MPRMELRLAVSKESESLIPAAPTACDREEARALFRRGCLCLLARFSDHCIVHCGRFTGMVVVCKQHFTIFVNSLSEEKQWC